MKKKVIYFITKSNWGGAQKQVFDLATALTKDKFDVSVACGGSGILVRRLKDNGIRVIQVSGLDRDLHILEEVKASLSIITILKKESPDVIHLHSSKAAAMGALLGKILGVKKIIFTAHGWPFKEDRGFSWKLFTWVGSFITVLLSDEVIVVSKDDLTRAPKLFSKSKIHLIHNGIGEIEFLSKSDARSKLAERLNIHTPNDSIWVGTGIELTANKGLTYAICAFKKVSKANKNVFLFIFGEGELRAELEDKIKKLSLTEKVFLLGHVENMPEYLKALDIYAQTSIKEGLPYAILEAGARGLPVVASNVGGIPEMIEDKKSGLLTPPKDEKAIARAMDLLISDEGMRKGLGVELKKKVAEEFSLADMKNKIFSLYLT
ncbi:MAG: glycosyltransferase family 4 protein [Parcubacteria group bacterium]|nr:glycosyltransferase family 4 protein [Parcubacteria group bacterium]